MTVTPHVIARPRPRARGNQRLVGRHRDHRGRLQNIWIKLRTAIPGPRWGLHGADAILKLRAIITKGDLDAYWNYHLTHERAPVHASRYADGIPAQIDAPVADDGGVRRRPPSRARRCPARALRSPTA
jgi:hypothetical protein